MQPNMGNPHRDIPREHREYRHQQQHHAHHGASLVHQQHTDRGITQIHAKRTAMTREDSPRIMEANSSEIPDESNMFLPDVPQHIDAAIFSGVLTNLLSRIGLQTRGGDAEELGAGSFEYEVLREDINGNGRMALKEYDVLFGNPCVRPEPPRRPSEWILKVTQRCCFSMTSVVCGLIYLDILTKAGKTLFTHRSWDLVWVSIMVMSEKFWEDNYIHPGHILYTSISDKIFQQDKKAYTTMLKMQFWLLDALDWRLNISPATFENWVTFLRGLGRKCKDSMPPLPQPIFIPRPIPNLKVRRTSALSQSTTSTATPDDLFISNNSDSTSNYGLQQPMQYHTNVSTYHNNPPSTSNGNQHHHQLHHHQHQQVHQHQHNQHHHQSTKNNHQHQHNQHQYSNNGIGSGGHTSSHGHQHSNNHLYTHGSNFPSRSTTSSDSSDLDDRRRDRSSKLGFYYQPQLNQRVAYPSLWTSTKISQHQKLPSSSRGKELLYYPSASKTSSPSRSLKYDSFRMPRDEMFSARKDRQQCAPPRIQQGKIDRSSCAAVNCLH